MLCVVLVLLLSHGPRQNCVLVVLVLLLSHGPRQNCVVCGSCTAVITWAQAELCCVWFLYCCYHMGPGRTVLCVVLVLLLSHGPRQNCVLVVLVLLLSHGPRQNCVVCGSCTAVIT